MLSPPFAKVTVATERIFLLFVLIGGIVISGSLLGVNNLKSFLIPK